MWPVLSILVLVVLLMLLLLAFVFRGNTWGNTSTDKLHMLYYKDGLWDIYAGVICLILAFAEWYNFALIGIVPAILYPMLLVAKQTITAPRLRPDDLPPAKDEQPRTMTLLVLGLAFLFGILAFVLVGVTQLPWLNALVERYLFVTVWIIVVVLFAIWGYFSKVKRLLGYATILLVAFFVHIWFEVPFYLYALGIGGMLCTGGIIVMMNFLREHPKLLHA